MMQTRSVEYRRFDQITMPDDFDEARVGEEARSLAKSYDRIGGHIHDPVVRRLDDGSEVLVAGRRRVAAHMVRGGEGCDVKIIECTDTEAEIVREMENAYREHSPQKQAQSMKRLVEIYELQEKQEEERKREETLDAPSPRKRGRPQLAKSRAREKVASLIGIKPQSVQRAIDRYEAVEQKAKKPGRKKRSKKVDNDVTESRRSLKTLGMGVGEEFLNEVYAIDEMVAEGARRISNALRLLGRLSGKGYDLPSSIDEAREHMEKAGELVRSARPHSLCPYCKGVPGVQDKCAICERRGWVGRLENVPVDLLDDSDPHITVHGEIVRVRDYLTEADSKPSDDPWATETDEPKVVYEDGEFDEASWDDQFFDVDPWS